MRILYIANIRIPTEKAHGVQIVKTCEAFAKAGHTVDLVVPDRKNTIFDNLFTYYGVAPIFSLIKLRVPNLMRFGRIGSNISVLWFSEKAHLCRQFWRADIIYSRDASILLQYILLGRRLVYEAHGAPTFSARIIVHFMYRVVVISKAIGEAYIVIGVPRKKIIIAPDGVDLDAFAHPETKEAARIRLGFPTDSYIAFYAGRLDSWKGIDTLLEASRFLSGVIVVIIGGETTQVSTLQKKYPDVRFLGPRPYLELADNQAVADVLVLPNTGKSEVSMYYTSPLKLFTYMASGVPIVTSDTPATREILDGSDAYFFTPDDPASLAEEIKNALAHTEDSKQKAQNSLEKVKGYTWDKRAGKILKKISHYE